MSKVSVLVAVYNAEKYLDKALRSLLTQTHKDIEVICTDDGSTDNSASILKRYSAEDERVKCIYLDHNQGQAKARNEGIKIATGDIITFLDSDDWFAPDTLEKIVKKFEDHPLTDCVLFRCVYVEEDGSERDYEGKQFIVESGKQAFLDSLDWTIHGVYAARAELYKLFPFDSASRHFSDDNTTRLHYFSSREVRQSDAPYYYLQHAASVSHVISASRMDYMKATDSMKCQLQELHCDETIMRLYENQRWRVIVDSYLFYFKYRNRLSNEECRYCLDCIRHGWDNIEIEMLEPNLIKKLGFNPMKNSWTLFRLEEEMYFFLKKLLRKL